MVDQRDSDSKAVSKTASTVQPERVLVPEPSIELKQSTIIPQNIWIWGLDLLHGIDGGFVWKSGSDTAN